MEAMREQAGCCGNCGAEAEPRPGFYARVMERIEAQGPAVHLERVLRIRVRPAHRRGVHGAGAAAGRLSGDVGADRNESRRSLSAVDRRRSTGLGLDQPGTPDRDAVLVNLVTYREQ